MEGFFTKEETESKFNPKGRIHSCVGCGLHKNCTTPQMLPYGNFKKEILIIGICPTEIDDKKGKPWQDPTGEFLKETFLKLGVDLFEDCLSIYAIMCLPEETPPYTSEYLKSKKFNYQVNACRKRVLSYIEKYKPKVVIVFGAPGVVSLVGYKWRRGNIGDIVKWGGWTIPDQDYKTWICPTFDPHTVEESLRQKKWSPEYVIWKKDLAAAFSLTKKRFKKFKEPRIEYIDDLSILDEIQTGVIAFDYETTGLKPHAKGHHIVCVAVATSPYHVYVFMGPKRKSAWAPFIRLLANPNVHKFGTNIKFEETWSVVRLKQSVKSWVWDTMLAAHVIDNRIGVTSLKFQAYVQFGVIDYEASVSPYLKSIEDKNGNSLNKVDLLLLKPKGEYELMKYCGYDAIFTYRLALIQRKQINL